MTAHSPLAVYRSCPPDSEDVPKDSPLTRHPFHRSPALPTSNPLYLREVRRFQEYCRSIDLEEGGIKVQRFVDKILDDHDKLYGVTERFSCRVCVLKAGKKGDKTCKCRRRVEVEEEKGTSIGDVREVQTGSGAEHERGDEQKAREEAAAEHRVERSEGLDIPT